MANQEYHRQLHQLHKTYSEHNLPVRTPYYPLPEEAQPVIERYPGSEVFVHTLLTGLQTEFRQGGYTKLFDEQGRVMPESVDSHTRYMLNAVAQVYERYPELDEVIPQSIVLPTVLNHDGGELVTGDLARSGNIEQDPRILRFLAESSANLAESNPDEAELRRQILAQLEQCIPLNGHMPDFQRICNEWVDHYYSQQMPFMQAVTRTLPEEYASHWYRYIENFEHRREIIASDLPHSEQVSAWFARFFDIKTENEKFVTHGAWVGENYHNVLGYTPSEQEIWERSMNITVARLIEPAVIMQGLLNERPDLQGVMHDLTYEQFVHMASVPGQAERVEEAFQYYQRQLTLMKKGSFDLNTFYREVSNKQWNVLEKTTSNQ
ncbi:MAG: hypothetical protein ACOCXQ_01540 [Patescibacteria group bacterium]